LLKIGKNKTQNVNKHYTLDVLFSDELFVIFITYKHCNAI